MSTALNLVLYSVFTIVNGDIYEWPKYPAMEVPPPNSFSMTVLAHEAHHGTIVINNLADGGENTFKEEVARVFFPGLDLDSSWGKYKITVDGSLKRIYAKEAVILATLDFEHAQYYQWFQQKSAQLIPNEYRRPTVQLSLVGSYAAQHPSLFTAGIFGGVGPLADADVVVRLITILNALPDNEKQLMQIKVLSDPPPRSATEALIDTRVPGITVTPSVGKRGSHYSIRARNFFHDPMIETFEITSNTAHRNLAHNAKAGFIDLDLTSLQINDPGIYKGRLAFVDESPNFVNPFTPGTRQLINVVSTTTKLIYQIAKAQDVDAPITVLIVGTDQAWNDKLYQKAFTSLDINYVDLNGVPLICKFVPEHVRRWEEWIAKMGTESHIGKRVEDMLKPYRKLRIELDKTRDGHKRGELRRKYLPGKPLRKFEAIEAGIQVIKDKTAAADVLFGAQIILDVMKEHIAEATIVAYTCSEVTIGVTPALYAGMVAAAREDGVVPTTIDTTQLMALNIAQYLKMRMRVKAEYLQWNHAQYNAVAQADIQPYGLLDDSSSLIFREDPEISTNIYGRYNVMEWLLLFFVLCLVLGVIMLICIVAGCVFGKTLRRTEDKNKETYQLNNL